VGTAGMPPEHTAHLYRTSPCAEDNMLVSHPGRPDFLLRVSFTAPQCVLSTLQCGEKDEVQATDLPGVKS